MKKSANILVLGKTHVSKSSFINYFLGADKAETGVGKPITQDITAYTFEKWGYPIELFDSKGIEAKSAAKQVDDIISEVKKRNSGDNVFNWFHTIFYCCSAEKKFEDFEAKFIKRLKKEISQHIHIIITKCDCVEPKTVSRMKERIKEKIEEENAEIFEVVSVDEEFLDVSIAEKRGIDAVKNRVFNLLWKDIADNVSARYAKTLRTAFTNIADDTLKSANKAIDEIISTKMLVSLLQDDGDTALKEKLDGSLKKVKKELKDAKKQNDKKFNNIINPLAEFYSDYKGSVTSSGSFVKNANLRFGDTFEWVNIDWINDIDVASLLKIAVPALKKNGYIGKDGKFKILVEPKNIGDVLKIIRGVGLLVYDGLGAHDRLKEFCQNLHDEFIKSVPSEKKLKKSVYKNLIKAVGEV